ncbi:hypothetical protein PT974_01103 [Cladobotryum mycophilum]|uniref:SnoaL-like domain-containing protein n=1 Tax=Cladobotryum mycophilum TaxID=491253 RepID=A0ABR0T415_9HYPO
MDPVARAQYLEAAHNSHDIDRFIDLFADNIVLSDYVLGVVNFDKAGIRTLYEGLFAGHENLRFTTRKASGTDELFAWEVDLSFTAGSAIGFLNVGEGQDVVLKGVSVQRWEAGKIYDQQDYFMVEKIDGVPVVPV